jgi:hypothetical protein
MERARHWAAIIADSNPTNPVSAKVDGAAQTAHKTTDRDRGQGYHAGEPFR